VVPAVGLEGRAEVKLCVACLKGVGMRPPKMTLDRMVQKACHLVAEYWNTSNIEVVSGPNRNQKVLTGTLDGELEYKIVLFRTNETAELEFHYGSPVHGVPWTCDQSVRLTGQLANMWTYVEELENHVGLFGVEHLGCEFAYEYEDEADEYMNEHYGVKGAYWGLWKTEDRPELTEKEALCICIDLWLWLEDHPATQRKDKWPGWERNGGTTPMLDTECPCCHYANQEYDRDHSSDNTSLCVCVYCPLKDFWPGDGCEDKNSPYVEWYRAEEWDKNRRRAAAQSIRMAAEEALAKLNS